MRLMLGYRGPAAPAAAIFPRPKCEAGRPGDGPRATANSQEASALRRRRCRWLGARATLSHERIELGLVLGHAQTAEEVVKLPLLLFEAPQRFLAVFVEGAIAA